MAIPNPNRGPPIKGWYYMRTWPKFSPLIVQKKSSGGSWKDSWFFTDGDCEFGESSDINSEYRVQTHFSYPK